MDGREIVETADAAKFFKDPQSERAKRSWPRFLTIDRRPTLHIGSLGRAT